MKEPNLLGVSVTLKSLGEEASVVVQERTGNRLDVVFNITAEEVAEAVQHRDVDTLFEMVVRGAVIAQLSKTGEQVTPDALTCLYEELCDEAKQDGSEETVKELLRARLEEFHAQL